MRLVTIRRVGLAVGSGCGWRRWVTCRLVAAVQGEFPESDPLVRALALKLAQAAVESHGTAGVQALRALGELVAAQRGGR